MRPAIVIASRNNHKIEEFKILFDGSPISINGLPSDFSFPEPVESGSTFASNANLKALYYSRLIKEPILADDSGLSVDMLNGAPGVHSSRFAGDLATDQENNQKLLSLLNKNITECGNRSAQFICHLVLARAGVVLAEATGFVAGMIANAPVGRKGFGYDPLFYFPPLQMTFAELTPEQKNKISHRYHAAQKMHQKILKYFKNTAK